MIVERFTFTEYDIRFRHPVRTSRGMIQSRRGFLIAAHSGTGEIGISEAAPLPLFGTEKHEQTREILIRLQELSIQVDVPENFREFPAWRASHGLDADECPAARFGIECALAGLATAQHRRRAHGKTRTPRRFDINGLVSGLTLDQRVQSAQELWSHGYRTLKIKIGGNALDKDVECVRRIRRQLPDVKLRLDANRGLTYESAERVLESLHAWNIEYIEDPVQQSDLNRLPELREKTKIRFALDESHSPREMLEDRVDWPVWSFLIIKPTRIGALRDVEAIEKRAVQQGAPAIYTSMFETSVGLSNILGFMSPGASTSFAHGLGTASLLSSDTFPEPLIPNRGRLQVVDTGALVERLSDEYRSRLMIE